MNSQRKRELMRSAAWYRAGRLDRAAGEACRSSNGAYLDGWYSDSMDGNYPGLPKEILDDMEAMNKIHEKAAAIQYNLSGGDNATSN